MLNLTGRTLHFNFRTIHPDGHLTVVRQLERVASLGDPDACTLCDYHTDNGGDCGGITPDPDLECFGGIGIFDSSFELNGSLPEDRDTGIIADHDVARFLVREGYTNIYVPAYGAFDGLEIYR